MYCLCSMNPFKSIFAFLLFLAALTLYTPVTAQARPDKIRIVMDDNYPPFSFRDSKGVQQGILIDQWNLWEQKTGVKVEIHAMDWGKALAGMKAGEFDVIDTIFKNEERSGWLDFTKPYARLDVPIFFDKEISGITNAASLKGFVVGAKTGDNAVNILKQSGVDNLMLFNSYEEIVRAARDHRASVFVVDAPPAHYFLHKMGILNNYIQSEPLYSGEFHRGVRKGNNELLEIVGEGFAAISPGELKKIDKKWYGSSPVGAYPLRVILIAAGSITALLLGMFLWNRVLSRIIAKRTNELKTSNERYKAIFEEAADGILLGSYEGVITGANKRMQQICGKSKEELIGVHISQFFQSDILEKTPLRFDLLAQGLTVVNQRCIVRPDGSSIVVEMHTIMLADGSYQSIYHDISERKKAEEDRLSLERQLLHAQKLESLGVLSGGIAHDFNNLLQALLGNLGLALIKLPGESAARKNIDQAIKAGEKAAQLTGMMLAYSGKGVFLIKRLNLSKLVEENAAILEAAIPKNITLEQRLDNSLPDIRADAGQLQQVIMNLITNAAESIGDQGGKISFSTGVKEFDQKTLENSRLEEKLPEGRYIWMEVRDSGCGMDADTVQKLFDPFFTTKFTGRGLGMSAVLGIIRAHKGAFLVESKPGIGTNIKVLFPLIEDQITTPVLISEARESLEEEVGNMVRILVVDDEEMIRSVSFAMLEDLGYKAMLAATGKEAIDLFKSQPGGIDLVLLDQVMPDMDGVAVCRELRKIKPDIKVLLSSGFSQQEVSERFSGLELSGILPKPYNIENLRLELSRLLNP